MSNKKQSGSKGTTASEFRLLCVGDIHLGRRPRRIPDDIEDYGVRKLELTPVAAWERVVAWAKDNNVDAVVLAGDVVESIDDRFEAYGHLERGARQLANAGIGLFGVAGNHDVQALPRLADHLEHFKLLGRGGVWESVELTKSGGAKLRLLGWSFPEQRVSRNPLEDPMGDIASDIPTIGILHCDVDGGNSPYAPVPRAAFEHAPGEAWLLGHIHKPDDLSATRPIGYLGSLVSLDPGEPGLHGPWLACVSKSGPVKLTQLSIAPLRYERIDLSIESIPDLEGEDLEDTFGANLRSAQDEIHDRIATTLGSTKVIGCRITLTGRSMVHEHVRRIVRDGTVQEGQTREIDGVVYFIEKIVDQSSPALDLDRISRGSDPPALLAQRLIHLQQGQAEAQRLIAAAATEIERATQIVQGSEVMGAQQLSTSDVGAILERAGFQALEDLLAQHSADEGDKE